MHGRGPVGEQQAVHNPGLPLRSATCHHREGTLGASPIAQAVGEKNAEVAGDGPGSAGYVLAEFAKALEHAIEAVEKSVSNYDNAELGSVNAVNRAGQR
ncbi:hypothetical protein GCM10012275_63320 [Longimycelium tulufanense]|uniref:Uncharacterized protein n=1 Tax=Longimycelium tulufanense TaxID=907463 RepID=A0A8J3CF16_9PSEU|nr:hypothetical protein [Longimycelium tulufanense]GGM84019.1 hypothetical protein GCM10012275_63320 [Longimycelium tulufanense]